MEDNRIKGTGQSGANRVSNTSTNADGHLNGQEVQNTESEKSFVKENRPSVLGKVKSLFKRNVEQTKTWKNAEPVKSDREMLLDSFRFIANTLQRSLRTGPNQTLKKNREDTAHQLSEFFTKYSNILESSDFNNEASVAEILQNIKNDFPREAFQKMAVELQEQLSMDPQATKVLQDLTASLFELTDSNNRANKNAVFIIFQLHTEILPIAANIAFQWAAEALDYPERASRLDQLSNFFSATMGQLLGKAIDALISLKPEVKAMSSGYTSAVFYLNLLADKLQVLKTSILSATGKTKAQTTLQEIEKLKTIAGEMSKSFQEKFFNGETVRSIQDRKKIQDDFNSGKGRYPSGIKKFFQNLHAQLKAI